MKRIYNERQGDLIGLYGDSKKKGAKLTPEEEAKAEENEEKRLKIINEINAEATKYAVWVCNLSHLAAFVFMSFVVIRFWPTAW